MLTGRYKFGRRHFLTWTGGAGALLLAACGAAATPTPAPAKPAAAAPASAPPPAAVTSAPAPAAPAAAPTTAPTVPAAASVAKPAVEVPVKFWYQVIVAQYEEPVRKILVDEFNEMYKGRIKLTMESNPDHDRVTRTAIAAGGAGDVIFSNGPTLAGQYAQAGQLVALDGYSADFKWKQTQYDWAYLSGVYDGKLISLQQTVETMCTWYNKTMFQKNNWKIPTNRAEYETLGTEMQKAKIIPFAHHQFSAHWYSVAYNNYAGAT